MTVESFETASAKPPGPTMARSKKLTQRPRGGILAALDIGTGKVCCFIARASANGPQIIGIGHQLSRGVRNGVIVDLDAASASVLSAIHAAEQMAGETITEVVVNLSGSFPPSRSGAIRRHCARNCSA